MRIKEGAGIRTSIRKRLITLLLIVTIIPIGSSIALTYMHTTESVKEKIIQENRNLMLQGRMNLTNYLETLNRFTYFIYTQPRLMNILKTGTKAENYNDVSEIKHYLNMLSHFNDQIEQAFLYSVKSGRAYSVSKRYVFTDREMAEEDLPAVSRRAGENRYNFYLEPRHRMVPYGVSVSEKFRLPEVITLHRRLTDFPADEFLGYIMLDFNLNAMLDIIDHLHRPQREDMLLVTPEGTIVYSTDELNALRLEERLIGLLIDRTGGQSSGVIDWKEQGFSGVVFYEKLPDHLGGWMLVKFIPYSYIYADARQIARINIVIGLAVLLLIVLATTFVSFRITSPLKVLLRNIQRIEAGRLEVDFESLGNDEIGYLGQRFTSMVNRIKSLILREYQLELQNRTNQLKVLQSQINPHFLNNALQSIGSLAVEQEAPQVYTYIRMLSEIMRYSMNSGSDIVPLSEELAQLRSYLELQKLRFEERLTYRIDCDPELTGVPVPKMMIQPIVENYFKHGFDHRDEAGYVGVTVVRNGSDGLEITVEDTGVGMDAEEMERLNEIWRKRLPYEPLRSGKTGLHNLYGRLQLYYGEAGTIRLEPRPGGGLVVRLTLAASIRMMEESFT